jgi:hypothetical protein
MKGRPEQHLCAKPSSQVNQYIGEDRLDMRRLTRNCSRREEPAACINRSTKEYTLVECTRKLRRLSILLSMSRIWRRVKASSVASARSWMPRGLTSSNLQATSKAAHPKHCRLPSHYIQGVSSGRKRIFRRYPRLPVRSHLLFWTTKVLRLRSIRLMHRWRVDGISLCERERETER